MNRPWMKFYPADWRAEPRLRMCSLAARGLWIDLMSYMHEGHPYGYLTINGTSPGIDDMAALVSRPIKEVQKAFDELEAKQVFSVNEDSGAIYSRRMVRDKAKAEKDQQNGKGGGNPKLTGEVKGGVNPPDKAHILEARKKESKSSELRSADDPRTRLFRDGAQLLADQTGRTPDSCKSLIGRWLKLTDDEAVHVLAAIEDAHRNRVADPTAWITATLQSRGKNGENRPLGQRVSAITAAIDGLVERFDGDERGGGEVREIAPRLLSHGRS